MSHYAALNKTIHGDSEVWLPGSHFEQYGLMVGDFVGLNGPYATFTTVVEYCEIQ